MKKTFGITAAVLVIFAGIGLVLSAFLTESWQQPQDDKIYITINPTVDEILGDDVKEYKFKEITRADLIEQGLGVNLMINYEAGMITYVQAASYGGSVLSKLYPDTAWEDIEFGIKLMEGSTGPYYHGLADIGTGHYCYYNVNAYTGKVTSVEYHNENMYKETVIDNEIITSDVEEDMIRLISERAKEFAGQIGYDEVVWSKVETGHNFDEYGDAYYKYYYIEMETEDRDTLNINLYDIEDKNYPLASFRFRGNVPEFS